MPPVLPSIGGSYLLVLHPELTRENICFCHLHAAQVLGLQLRAKSDRDRMSTPRGG